MIHFAVKAKNQRPILKFLDTWGSELSEFVRVVPYERLLAQRRLAAGTYVFSDLERLSARDVERAVHCWDQLEASGAARLMNHPRRVLLRYPLLRRLHQQGINDFDVHRVADREPPKRFPVFVRRENDHEGPLTQLLHSQGELDAAVEGLCRQGERRGGLLVTGYCAAAGDDGLFRKYGALLLDGRILPCHLVFAPHWIVKGRHKVVDANTAAEELRFVRKNPHEAMLAEIFAMAGIDYGRIDYGFASGRIQVYEINTNPQIMGRGPPRHPERLAKKELFASALIAAFEAMERASPRARPGSRGIHVQPLSGRLRGWVDGMTALLR